MVKQNLASKSNNYLVLCDLLKVIAISSCLGLFLHCIKILLFTKVNDKYRLG